MYAVLYTAILAITAWEAVVATEYCGLGAPIVKAFSTSNVDHMHMLRSMHAAQCARFLDRVCTLVSLLVYILPANAIPCSWGS